MSFINFKTWSKHRGFNQFYFKTLVFYHMAVRFRFERLATDFPYINLIVSHLSFLFT